MMATLTGALAGLLHVFSGPDHLAAVAPLSIDHGRNSWSVGLRWGIGHSLGVILLGLLLMALKEMLPLDSVSSWAERFVGVVLIGIGLWGGRKALAKTVHLHTHQHDGHRHAHLHVHGGKTAHPPHRHSAHHHTHAVTGVGLLHGLAGGSHLIGLLVALAFPTRWERVSYIVAYALGTILAMSSFSSLIGWIAGRWAIGGTAAYRYMMFAFSGAALLVGGYWLVGPVGP